MRAENYQNRNGFDKDIAKIKQCSFLPHMVVTLVRIYWPFGAMTIYITSSSMDGWFVVILRIYNMVYAYATPLMPPFPHMTYGYGAECRRDEQCTPPLLLLLHSSPLPSTKVMQCSMFTVYTASTKAGVKGCT